MTERLSDISVVIPALNEAEWISAALISARGAQRIVVDGGSRDETVAIARSHATTVLKSAPGRARQMNLGAQAAIGKFLLFLHADTRLPPDFARHIRNTLAEPDVAAGAFRLGIDSRSRSLRLIEALANWRAHHLQLPYGDQGLFLEAARFHQMGGFPDMPIMEDFALVRRLRKTGRVALAPVAAVTSGRRWERLGPWRTTWTNQVILAGYALGISPTRLARWYRTTGDH